MFQKLGNFVVRFWPFLLIAWIGLLVAVTTTAPPFNSVVDNGEFAFLPDDLPSRLGEKLFKQAWKDPLTSRTVVVVRRESHKDGLLDQDRKFVDEVLKPAIEQIAVEEGGLAYKSIQDNQEGSTANDQDKKSIIARVRTYSDKSIGRLLNSEDNKATLVIAELTTEFLDVSNGPVIDRIEGLFSKDQELLEKIEKEFPGSRKRNEEFRKKIPPGLALATSGDATVGRDMMRAGTESSNATEQWTVILVVVLLILIYRAPGLAIIPLLTVGVGTEITLAVLAHLADLGVLKLFDGIQVYVKILCYGAGVDYCLFLIARYKEELDDGNDHSQAVALSISHVGKTLTASAFTVICGIGMMRVADFGKFQQAGTAIAMGLFIVLCTALTFTPSLLKLAGRWAFWPKVSGRQLSATAGWISPTSLVGRLIEKNLFQAGWKKMGQALLKRPGFIWLTSVAVMMPFAVIGVSFSHFLSYGLLTELPQDNASVVGAKAIQLHFPAGTTGPVTILLKHPQDDFSTKEGIEAIRWLADRIENQKNELQLADIRSAANPFGITSADNGSNQAARKLTGLEKVKFLAEQRIRHDRTLKYYVSYEGEFKGRVTRLDFILQNDPFSRGGIEQLNRLQGVIETTLAESSSVSKKSNADDLEDSSDVAPLDLSKSELLVLGPTASIRDLKTVTDGDQIRIGTAVLISVFLILVLLLRRPAISLYLILSVFFSYLVALGATFTLFWFLDGADFAGLDWKVPIFLFCILIAVGEDYNIFLMTRIDEEQRRHGPIEGIVIALQKTGSIISSCGIIMAGTFLSLLAGSLVGMHQLGFALAFGVLLDTFVVRPILVPAYLIMLYRGQLGVFGKLHEADKFLQKKIVPSVEVTSDQ